MRVLLVLPRHMHFTPRRATSIDLCAYELLLHSRHKATTRVVCAEEAEYFPDVDVASFGAGAGSTRRLLAISREVKRFAPDIIVVHQHLRTVFLLSVLHPGTPVVLHRHNYYPPKLSWMSRLVYQAYWRRISSVLFVSEHCRSGFLAHSDYDPGHTFVVPNGLDFSAWTPAAVRDRTVMFAGRAVPEKGGLEAAEATAAALAGAKDWRALFFMAQPEKAPDYMEKVRAALAPLGDRAEILSNAPFEQVKAGFETAAIALVPSVWEEPFGRTAIEAMAGGAALICSGRGGLDEVIGSDREGAALRVEPTAEAMLQSLTRMMADEPARVQLASAGNARAQRQFSIQHIAARYDRLLEDVVLEAQPSRSSAARHP